MMETLQLNDWLQRWRAGDSQAREELLRAAYPRMEALARTMLRSFPALRRFNDTGDVLQNATLRLIRSLRQIDPLPASTREFFGLAAAEIRRELLDLARSLTTDKRRGEVPPTGGASPVNKAIDPRASGDDLEWWTTFHESVDKLPAEEREVVGLLFYHGWTQARVAELFGVSERTIARRWFAACLRLEQALDGRLPADL
jgi:RNA polymerase sigma-70 factor (ECF subfamily)